MTTRRMLTVGLATMIAAFAFSGASAFATEFQAAGNTSQGAQALEAETTAAFSAGETQVVCAEVSGGQWHIQDSKSAQSPTKQGPKERLSGSFTKCTTTIGGLKLASAVNSTCVLEVRTLSPTSAAGSVSSDCEVKIPAAGCTLKIAAADNPGPLTPVTIANSGTGVKIKSAIASGIVYTPNSCPGLTTKTNNAGFKANTVTQLQSLV